MSSKKTAPAPTSLVSKLTVLWKGNKYLRWAVILASISVSLNFFIAFLDKPVLVRVPIQLESHCGEPVKDVEPWQIRTFRPKWLGLFGDPAPLTYLTKGERSHQVAIIDIDKRDIEIRMWMDGEDRGSNPVQIDHTVHCGEDVGKCIGLGFATGVVVIPPGQHTVTAEIVQNPTKPFRWGSERKRRVMWLVQECPSANAEKARLPIET